MRKLYIKQKIFKIVDKYYVKDEDGNDVYYVKQDFTLIGNRVHMYDMEGNRLFTIEKEIRAFLPRYTIQTPEGESITIQNKFKLFKMDFDIKSSRYNLDVSGNFLDKDFDIYENGNIIANIDRKLFAIGDTFEIEVYDESKEIIIVALMIAIDNIIDRKQRN